MAGMLGQGCLEQFVSNANDVINFKLIREEKDIADEDIEFPPEFTHQFFGDSESIFGYTGLKVDIYYSASKLVPFFRTSYDEVVSASRSGGVEADNVHKIISDKLEMPLPSNINTFSAALQKESTFVPCGKQINSFSITDDDSNQETTYEVYRACISDTGFRDYHERMQTFILWFIDAASYIDIDDDRWEFFIIYERSLQNGEPRYYFIGYATVYRYYAYPTKLRPRISQMMVLPPFQKQGIGSQLLQSLYDWYIQDSNVLDITVEDPSENFTRLRDFVDCKNCMNLRTYQKNELVRGFSKEMSKEAQEKFKICQKQARRVYEILRLKGTNVADKREYRSYRLLVKKRLNAPFQRQKLDMEKLRKTLSQEEYIATVNCTSTEQRMEQLERLYKDLETEYKQVIDRLLMVK